MISASSYIQIMATFNCQHLKTLKLCGHVQRKASYHDWLHYQSTQATKKLLNLSEATEFIMVYILRKYIHLKRQCLLFADKKYRLKYKPSATRDSECFAEPTSVSLCFFVSEEADTAPR